MGRLTLICIFLQLSCTLAVTSIQIELNGTIIASEGDVSKLDYPYAKIVTMNYPKLYALSKEILQQLNSAIDVRVEGGQVPTVELVPKLIFLKIVGCETNQILIDPNFEYEIYLLYVARNNLQTIPNNVGALKKLRSLYLIHNKIEYVDMEDFDGMQQLEKLFLYANRIVEIGSPQFYSVWLPKLAFITLANNKLSLINFEHWDMPLLEEVILSHNNLTVALFLSSENFPSLKKVSLWLNPWNCQWLNNTKHELETNNITLLHVSQNSHTCKESEESLDELTERIQSQLKEQAQVCRNPRKVRSKFQKLQEQIRALRQDAQKALKLQTDEMANLKSDLQRADKINSKLSEKLFNAQKTNAECEQETQNLQNAKQEMTTKMQQLQSFNAELKNYVEQTEDVLKCLVGASEFMIDNL